MSNAEMHYDFDVKIDKVASLSNASFNTAEKDWLLTEAHDMFTKRVFRSKFELNQKKIDDLSTLVIKGEEVTPVLLNDSGIYEFDLDLLTHSYMFFIRGSVEVVESSSCSV